MLNTDLLSLSGVNRRWDVNEVLHELAVLIDLLDRAVSLSWDRHLILLLNLSHDVDRVCVVKLELLIDFKLSLPILLLCI